MSLEFTISAVFPVKASTIYEAWLDSDKHAKMTAAEAAVQSKAIGADHKAHGDYIWGINLELFENWKIKQSWRTAEFQDGDADSTVEITLEESKGLTKVILRHHGLPDTEGHYEKGWEEHYFEPMRAYFASLN